MGFTTEQKSYMVEAYFRNASKINGDWTYSIPDCLEEFRGKFPEVNFLYADFVHQIKYSVGLFRQTGSVTRKPASGRPKKRTEGTIENVRQIMADAPKTSLRRLSQQIELSYGTCKTILKQDLHMFPYKITAVHELLPPDYPQRRQFCAWFLNNFDDNLLDKTFFSDEAWFHLSGYVNSQNMRVWSAENPHVFIETPLHPEKIGVWVGLSRRRLIGPIFFQGTLTAARYRQEVLLPFIEQLDDEELQLGYMQQDGATPHCAAETINLLREFFDDRLISRNTPNIWPPRSCDLTPLDFFLWPYIKNSIFQHPVDDLDELARRITLKCNEINNSPNLLRIVIDGVRRRARKCLEVDGAHFQHLL